MKRSDLHADGKMACVSAVARALARGGTGCRSGVTLWTAWERDRQTLYVSEPRPPRGICGDGGVTFTLRIRQRLTRSPWVILCGSLTKAGSAMTIKGGGGPTALRCVRGCNRRQVRLA